MKFKKLWITALLLCLSGAVLTTMGLSGGALKELEKTYITTKRQDITLEEFKQLDIQLKNQGLWIVPSDDDQVHLEYYQDTKQSQKPIQYQLTNGKLTVTDTLTEFSGIHVANLKDWVRSLSNPYQNQPYTIMLSIPKSMTLDTIKAQSQTGEISIDQVNVKNLTITSQDGSVILGSIQPETTQIKTQTGAISLSKTKLTQPILESIDGEISDYGSHFTQAQFKTQTAEIYLDQSLFKGQTTIASTDGNITLQLPESQESQTHISATSTDFGQVSIPKSYANNTNSSTTLDLKTDTGDISVNPSYSENDE